MVDESTVTGYVEVNCIDLRIRGDCLGGIVVTNEPPRIFSNLLEGNILGLKEEIENIPQVGLPKIFPKNISRVWNDGSGPRGGDVHNCVESKLRHAVLEEINEDVRVDRGEGGWFPPFCLLRGRFSLIFPSFNVKSIEFVSYGLISEDISFALALTWAGDMFNIALVTAEVIAPVMAAINASSAARDITALTPLLASIRDRMLASMIY